MRNPIDWYERLMFVYHKMKAGMPSREIANRFGTKNGKLLELIVYYDLLFPTIGIMDSVRNDHSLACKYMARVRTLAWVLHPSEYIAKRIDHDGRVYYIGREYLWTKHEETVWRIFN